MELVSKGIGIEMNCRQVNIRLCQACESNKKPPPPGASHWECFIDSYCFNLRKTADLGATKPKEVLLEIIMYPGRLSMIHFGEAVRQVYPEHWNWYIKMLLLK